MAEHIITFKKPYSFEGKEYTELDLSGIDKLTVNDAVKAQKQLFDQSEVAATLICETTTAFARIIANMATGLPIEFFKLMPIREAKQVTLEIQSALSSTKEVKDHIIEFDEPYNYDGKKYENVNISGMYDLNSMNMSTAENRITREGFFVTATQFNYLYCCILASMAAGLPEDFFTGLPICETLKVKNAVNDSDFFE